MAMTSIFRSLVPLAACVLLHGCCLSQVVADDGLPTAWRQGIATFYGGAPDGMVST
jgi:outer membrane biogenesis lipoprotein LolB